MAYRDSTVGTGSSATPSCAVPASVAIDDIVILVASIDSSAAVFDTGDFPTGFTRFADTNITADGQSVGIGWKRLTAADSGSYTFGDVGGSGDWVCEAFAFSGRHTTNAPEHTAAVQNTGSSNPSPAATGVTAVEGDDLLMVSALDTAGDASTTLHVAPTNYTEREDTDNVWTCLAGFTRENVSAGATGTITATTVTSPETAGWAAYLVRIPVASAGGRTTKNTRAFPLGMEIGMNRVGNNI